MDLAPTFVFWASSEHEPAPAPSVEDQDKEVAAAVAPGQPLLDANGQAVARAMGTFRYA